MALRRPLTVLAMALLLVSGYLAALYVTLPEQRLSRWLRGHAALPVDWQGLKLRGGELLLERLRLKQRPGLLLERVRIRPHWWSLLLGRPEARVDTDALQGSWVLELASGEAGYRVQGRARQVDLADAGRLLGPPFDLPVQGKADLQFQLALAGRRQLREGSFKLQVPALELFDLRMQEGTAEGDWQQGRWLVKGRILGDLLAEGQVQLTPKGQQALAYGLSGSLDLRKGGDNPLLNQVLPEGRALLSLSGRSGDYRVKCNRADRYCPRWVSLLP